MLVKFHLIYVSLLFFISNGRFCYCQSSSDTSDTDPDRNELNTPSQLVEELVRKVCNMTTHALASSPNDKKELLIQKIENELLELVKDLQFNNSYVKLLMKGVKLVAYNNAKKHDDTEIEIEHKSNMPSKEALVNNIAKKVEYIAKTYSETESAGDKSKVMEDIKQEVKKAALKKHKELHDKHDKIITYSKLISRGIAQAMDKINEARRMEHEFVNRTKPYEYTTEESTTFINKGVIEATQAQEQISSTIVMPSGHKNVIRELECGDIKKHICTEIKLLNTLKCYADNTELSIEKLCDGTVDCSDSSDEINCAGTALEVVRKASEVMTEIELAINRQCYPLSVQNNVISKENAILKDVLRNQVNLIQKHSNNDGSPDFDTRSFPAVLNKAKKTTNEVVKVIHTLALALQSALCPDHKLKNRKSYSESSENIRTNNYISEDINHIKILPIKATLASCICDDQNCAHSNCRDDCKDVCGQKYSFGRWHCDALNQAKSVSLDELCDGKLDCFDESDENGCFEGSSLSKFEATNMFSLIVQSALLKSQTERVSATRVLLVKFVNNVKSLQMLIGQKSPDTSQIKGIRDQCIVDMTSVYEEYLKRSTSMVQMNEIYAFLVNLKEKLISAIKRSHTGNDRVITADGCYCTHHECSLSSCSKSCVKACRAEPILTRYYCGDSNRYEDSIPITSVCNGKKDCPYNDDEVDCKKDICRKHHIVLLKHNLRNLGNHARQTAFGEALYSWKLKVAATLRMAESDNRPTPKVFRGIVKSILRDLLMTYAGMEETLARRSNNDIILNQFYNISQTVIRNIKSCGQ